MTIALGIFFAIWFALSVANQVPALSRRLLGTLNSFCLLPALSLFAPDPCDVDYHLVWRDRQPDGAYGPWREVAMPPGGRARALWNPTGRDGNAMLQIVSALSLLGGAVAPTCRNGSNIILVSLPYLVLLNVAMAQPRDPGAVARQFAILESSGFGASRRVEIGITSPLHRLEPA